MFHSKRELSVGLITLLALPCPVGMEYRTGVESKGYSSGVGQNDHSGAYPVAAADGTGACPVEPGTLWVFNWGEILFAII